MGDFILRRDIIDRVHTAQTVNANLVNANKIIGPISGNSSGIVIINGSTVIVNSSIVCINASAQFKVIASNVLINSSITCINASGQFKVIASNVLINCDTICINASGQFKVNASDVVINSTGNVTINASDNVNVNGSFVLNGHPFDIQILSGTAVIPFGFVGPVFTSFLLIKQGHSISLQLTPITSTGGGSPIIISPFIPPNMSPSSSVSSSITVLNMGAQASGMTTIFPTGDMIIGSNLGDAGGSLAASVFTGGAGITYLQTLKWLV